MEANDTDANTGGQGSRIDLLREPDNWPLFYQTARNMEHRQLVGVLERTIRQQIIPRLPVDFDHRYEQRISDSYTTNPEPIQNATNRLRRCLTSSRTATYRDRLTAVKRGDARFLNTTIAIEENRKPNWFHPALDEEPALWALKLHGFEFLNWAVFGIESPADCPEEREVFRRWIRAWSDDDRTDIGTDRYLRRAWTPHSVSLRVLNLSRYYSWCVEVEEDRKFLDLLRRLIFKNARFLESHVEYDVGGNHLIENAVALVAAGVLFPGADTEWLDTGISLLESAESQYLSDGGHFERSPMYHIITLTRYLTVIDLLQESSGDCPLTLQQTARRATVFLEALRPPDGRIPLLNDAVFCEALQLDTCLAYARALGFNTPSTTPSALTESGYFWLDAGDDRLLVDGGPFGPPHLPSHSHNDLFSILLWIDGNRLLTDTGTYSYAPTPRRQYARSVEGHNTVQIGSTEPVPIGGQYLAGKRLDPRIRYVQAEDVSMFDGKYERHNFSDRIYTHRRRIFAAEEWWLIQDHVTQDDEKPIRGRLHLHPQVAIGTHPTESAGFALQIDDEPLLYGLSPDSRVTETTTPYFPEFGIERERRAIVTETTSADETMNLLLSKRPYTYAEYQRAVSSLADVDHPDIGNPQSENQLT